MEMTHVERFGDAQFTHCPTRALCPLGEVCADPGASGGGAIYPTICELGRGEELWADARYEQRVYLIRAGVLACVANTPDGEACPAALYGPGDSFGLAELYSDREICSTYHMWALAEARVCSLPARALRRVLKSRDAAFAQRVMGDAFMNVTCSMYFQSRVMSKMKAEERVLMLLGRIAELAGREGRRLEKVHLGQGDLALLAGADRVCVGRALHKLADAGLVALGYRTVELLPLFFESPHPELARLEGFRGAREAAESAR